MTAMSDVADLFDYDAELRRHNDHFRAAAGVGSGDRVLDIGCGTGQSTREAAHAAVDGSVVGVDVSAPMLERARRRGELGPDIDVAMAASLVPSLMLQRALMTGQPAGRAYAEQVVGSVLLPVLGRPARPLSTTNDPETTP